LGEDSKKESKSFQSYGELGRKRKVLMSTRERKKRGKTGWGDVALRDLSEGRLVFYPMYKGRHKWGRGVQTLERGT